MYLHTNPPLKQSQHDLALEHLHLVYGWQGFEENEKRDGRFSSGRVVELKKWNISQPSRKGEAEHLSIVHRHTDNMSADSITEPTVKTEWKEASNLAEYKEETEKMIQRFLEELNNTDNTWEAVFSTPQIQAWKKLDDQTGIIQVKFIAMIPYPQSVVEKLPTRKAWDSMISEIKPIEKFEDGSELILFEAPGLFGVGGRDLLHYRTARNLNEDNANILIDISVTNEKVPVTSNFVRGHTVLSAGKFQPTKAINKETKKLDDATLYSMISELDVKGIIPKTVINLLAPSQTQSWFDNLMTACDKESKGKSVAPKGWLSGWL
ncbi:START domain containing protein [Planoprotostelium fungivorum]|uniref:START domain containing protein n=1 Tax=Planoprotostelium fungivorum TaxID=1890364 RepID=A0A2P6NCL2_9EUKA|nr:START domain containing protein [Planoprotostelium fungivorum]